MTVRELLINPLSANTTKWSNTLKQFVSNLARKCLGMFDHFVALAPKGLSIAQIKSYYIIIQVLAKILGEDISNIILKYFVLVGVIQIEKLT